MGDDQSNNRDVNVYQKLSTLETSLGHLQATVNSHVTTIFQLSQLVAANGYLEHEVRENAKELKELSLRHGADLKELGIRHETDLNKMGTSLRDDLYKVTTAIRDDLNKMGESIRGDLNERSTSIRDELHTAKTAIRDEIHETKTAIRDELKNLAETLGKELHEKELKFRDLLDVKAAELDRRTKKLEQISTVAKVVGTLLLMLFSSALTYHFSH